MTVVRPTVTLCAVTLAERDAWLSGISVAISCPLADLVLNNKATFREIASRCCVPEQIVSILVGLGIALGEVDGDRGCGYEVVHHELLEFKQWFNDRRARGFQEWSGA